jgi:hypothetical protein
VPQQEFGLAGMLRAQRRGGGDAQGHFALPGLDRLFELAAEKDHGFTREMFAEMAGRFSRLRPEEFGLDRQQYEQLERKVLEWQERARHR